MKIKRKHIIPIALIIFQALVLVLIATGADILESPILNGYELSWINLLTWFLFSLFPLNFLLIRRQSAIHKVPRLTYTILATAGLFFGVSWLFVSFLLAGNWSFNFEDNLTSFKVWQTYTSITPLLPFAGYFLMRVLMLFYKKTGQS